VPGPNDVVVLKHGTEITLQLRVDPNSLGTGGGRRGEFTISAVEQTTQAILQLSMQVGELHRFGVEP
jgi:hypothetical protein